MNTPNFESAADVASYRGASYVIDINRHIPRIFDILETEGLSKILIEPPAGLYLDNDENPLLVFDQPYYDAEAFRVLNSGDLPKISPPGGGIVPSRYAIARMPPEMRAYYSNMPVSRLPTPINTIAQLKTVREGLCDRYGNIVLQQRKLDVFRNRLQLFQSKHFIAANLIRTYIYDFVQKASPHSCVGSKADFSRIIKPEYMHAVTEGYLTPYMSNIHRELLAFLDNGDTNIYFLSTNENLIIIELYMDYRIYEYYRNKYPELP